MIQCDFTIVQDALGVLQCLKLLDFLDFDKGFLKSFRNMFRLSAWKILENSEIIDTSGVLWYSQYCHLGFDSGAFQNSKRFRSELICCLIGRHMPLGAFGIPSISKLNSRDYILDFASLMGPWKVTKWSWPSDSKVLDRVFIRMLLTLIASYIKTSSYTFNFSAIFFLLQYQWQTEYWAPHVIFSKAEVIMLWIWYA